VHIRPILSVDGHQMSLFSLHVKEKGHSVISEAETRWPPLEAEGIGFNTF
jgi:predicted lipoprotein with Yx(FWY)xxD motif